MDMPRTFITSREREVWERLHTVTDPELDEPVTDLQFVSRADVDAKDCVHIDFRLPTYWCAANFSFLMADDMRRAVQDLPWVKAVNVTLGEHMYADRINAGLKKGLSFQETFGDEADGDLDALRSMLHDAMRSSMPAHCARRSSSALGASSRRCVANNSTWWFPIRRTSHSRKRANFPNRFAIGNRLRPWSVAETALMPRDT